MLAKRMSYFLVTSSRAIAPRAVVRSEAGMSWEASKEDLAAFAMASALPSMFDIEDRLQMNIYIHSVGSNKQNHHDILEFYFGILKGTLETDLRNNRKLSRCE